MNRFARPDIGGEDIASRAVELVKKPDQDRHVPEETAGELLTRLLGTPMAVERFLRLSIAITAAVENLHRQGLVHGDLKPDNIVVGRTDDTVRIGGLGIASRLAEVRHPRGPPELIAGTLAYMAPEQTGRMNRSVDSRSDLYALGVIFYEMLTGSPLFQAGDAAEWVHFHMARQPPSPVDRVPGMPAVVCEIVMKLLAKAAEDRYQTAAGLQIELERCLSEWATWHRIEPFVLGKHDIPSRPLIPARLYGRSRDIETLCGAFEEVVANGAPQLVLVAGYSGIGKSALVHELQKVLGADRALFASGKFDQYKRDVPYATVAQAFQGVIRELLSLSEGEMSSIRDSLRQALGPNGLLMVGLVPQLALIIGPQPAVPELPPLEEKARFQLVFRRFLGVFARTEHPLVLFLDDLQWLDAATLDLVESLMTQPNVRHLLLVGAFRDNEVGPDHPLRQRLDALRQIGARARQMVLSPLDGPDLTQLLAGCLHCGAERLTPLAQLILAKTGGNPFFSIQFISTLVEESLLTFDHASAQWQWDLALIEAKGYTDNVAHLMTGALNRLPAKEQQILQLLACVGDSAGPDLLSTLRGSTEEEVRADLCGGRQFGLVVQKEGAYAFAHDRVRETAYSMLHEERRTQLHLTIGQLLAARLLHGSVEDAIFDVVAQFDRCSRLIQTRDAREQVAGLYLLAAKRAKAAAAYASALKYLVSGAALLDANPWERQRDVAFQLELLRGECELLTGDSQAADQRLTMLSGRATSIQDRSAVDCLRVELLTALDRPDRAVRVCLDYLATVGIAWRPQPSDAQARSEYAEVWGRLGNRTIEDLVELPLMSDPATLATLDVLTKCLVPALITDPNLLCLTACRIVNLSLQEGNTDGSCLGYQWFGMVARTRFGNQDGFRFSRLGFELVERKGLRRFQGRACTTHVQFVPLWTEHIRTCFDLLRNAFEVTSRVGDLTYATYSLDCMSAMLLMAGEPLADVQCSVEQALEFAQSAQFGFMSDVLIARTRLILTLRGQTSTFGSFDGGGFDETSFERHLASDSRLKVAQCWYWIAKLQARFRAGDYPAGMDALDQATCLVASLPPVFTETAEYHFYGALCNTASVASGDAGAHRMHRERAGEHQKQIEAWALNCPETFENRVALVGAELARIDGRELEAERLYEHAIRSARANGFTSNEALANELAARFHEDRGLETIASAYLAAARSCYLKWGAHGKVRQLDRQYPRRGPESDRPDATQTILADVELLDLATVTRILQALSGEIVLEKLVATVMRVALEHAGAQRGLFILPRQEACEIRAEAEIVADAVDVNLLEAAVTAADLPESVLHYVVRTQETLLLHDASAEHPFSSDGYVQRNRAHSVLCLPLMKLNRLVGIIYLENNLARGVFTPARIALLNLLASEAAASLECARVFRDLEQRGARVQRLMDSNVIGIATWHADGRILDTNDELMRIVGYTREDLVAGRVRWMDLMPPESREQGKRDFEEVQQAGVLQALERELLRKDGTRVPVMVGAAMFGGTDEGVGFVVDLTERKRAEYALREMERETRLIVDTIPGLVATLSTAGAVEAINKELVEYCGQGLDAMRNWGTNGTVHLEDVPRAAGIFTTAIAAGEPYLFEARIRRFDGVYRWFQVRGLPFRATDGRILRWYALLSDCDDRKRAEQALLESERNLKLIVDTIPALAWSARPDGGADFFNQHYLDFVGFSTMQASGWGWTGAVHADDLQELTATWQRILESGCPGEAEARLRRFDGEYRWFLFRVHPLRDQSGTITKWYGANTDIEDRKRMEAELRRAYNSFRDAQRLSKTGSFITDLTRDEHTWSEETYSIFGFEPGTTVTVQRVMNVIHPDDAPAFAALIARGMTGTDVQFAFRAIPAPGVVKHVRGFAHVVEHVAGRPMFVGAMQDVTESMVAEEALSKARSELAHVARVTSLSTLTASITHEVSQPLSGIVTNANTCLRMLNAAPPNVEGAGETVRRIVRDGNRAAEVITRLRAMFSKKDLMRESVDLNEATREVIALSMSDIHRNRVMLQQELAEDLPLVTGDRVQLQQVILNLLRNACEAMAAIHGWPRHLIIRTAVEKGGSVCLTVRDAGVGLAPQTADKLFDAFYTTKSGGMGIGLSVSRSIIERHQGRIWAEPNDGPGASFSFSIPAAAAG